MDCARKTIAVDGIGALWKGFGPAMARAFPANAATFVSLIPDFVHRSIMIYFPFQLGVEASRRVLDGFF